MARQGIRIVAPPEPVPGPEGPQGEQGPPGPQGPQGEPGSGSSSYTHNQGTPSADWTITHNLGYQPAGVYVIDSGGNPQEGWVEHVSVNSLIVHFNVPFGGTAIVS